MKMRTSLLFFWKSTLQLRGAMGASGCLNCNFGFAEGTDLRCGCFFYGSGRAFQLHQHLQRRKDDDCHNQKIKHLCKKGAVCDGCGCRLRICKGGIMIAVQRQIKLAEICAACQLADDGIIKSLTKEVTILPNAPPMITPTAISTTLPFMANSLNS